jgi:hypothetical protein
VVEGFAISEFVPTLWAIFALQDPDPDSEYVSGRSGSTDLIESGSNPDLDPDLKPWLGGGGGRGEGVSASAQFVRSLHTEKWKYKDD